MACAYVWPPYQSVLEKITFGLKSQPFVFIRVTLQKFLVQTYLYVVLLVQGRGRTFQVKLDFDNFYNTQLHFILNDRRIFKIK